MTSRRRERLVAACSNNGKLVHLVNAKTARAACGYWCGDVNKVHARVTCRRCAAKRPVTAKRYADRPLVVGIDHAPFYEACRRALEAGATDMPKPKVAFWPVLG